MGRTSSETLIAKAKAELEEERKVGTGLTELKPKKKKKATALALWTKSQHLQHWQPKPLVWFPSQPGIWSNLFLTL